MLLELQTSILAKWNSAEGATIRSLTQGLWPDLAPSTVKLGTQKGEDLSHSVLPFITFSTITTGLTQDFCENMYEPLVQFTIFGDGNNKTSISVLQIGQEFLNLYGDKLLTMTNGYTMVRNDTVDQRVYLSPAPEKFWQVIYMLQFIVEKDR